MMNFVGLGLTLVISQIITMVIVTVLGLKIVGSKWFIKKYMDWFTKTMNTFIKEMGESFENIEL